MPISTLALIVALAVLVAAAGLIAARMIEYRPQPADPDREFNFTRFAAMERLLDPEEVAFLASQPGMDAKAISNFRKERRMIFRMYLHELSDDFHALHAEARELAAVSPEKGADLIEGLMRQQFRFWISLAVVECQLMLESFGIGRVDPRALLDVVGNLHSALVRATAVPGPVAVPNS